MDLAQRVPDHSGTDTKESSMNAITEIIDAHLVAYCNPDEAKRLQQLQQIWRPEGRLIDPPLAASGHEAISALAAQLLTQFPGHTFARTTTVDSHHDFARYGWKLQDPQGNTVLEGVDFASFDDSGRIAQVVGFFGAQPPRE
jgi:hypothetical protein